MTILKAIFVTLIFIVISYVLSLWIFLLDYERIDSQLYKYYILISSLLQFALVLVFIRHVLGKSNFLPKKTESKFYFAAIALGVSYPYIQTPLNEFHNFIFDSNYRITYEFSLERISTIRIIESVILVPILEEYFFRGYILKKLLEKHKAFIALIISSFLFAIIHLPFEAPFFDFLAFDIHKAYLVLLGGMISGILYLKSNSVGPSIIFHLFWNLTVMIF
jgi:membrane protease YdiL (CAAX protease family)